MPTREDWTWMTVVGYVAKHAEEQGRPRKDLSLPRNGSDIPWPLGWAEPEEYAYPNELI